MKHIIKLSMVTSLSLMLCACSGGSGTTTSDQDQNISTPNTPTTTPIANTAPLANNDSIAIQEDALTYINLIENDTDEQDNITDALLLVAPLHGVVSIVDGLATYTPETNYNGTDSFTYKAKDARDATSNEATVSIAISPVNDAPIIDVTPIEIEEDGYFNVRRVVTDPEGDAIKYTHIIHSSNHGTIMKLGSGHTRYFPHENYYGSDKYTLKSCDEFNACSTADIPIIITSVNDTPFAYNSLYKLSAGENTLVELNASDADIEDTLSYEVISTPQHGTFNTNTMTYTANATFKGTDYISYEVSDSSGETAQGRAYFNVDNIAPYITRWDTSVHGKTSSNQLKIGTNPLETYNFSVDWGDGTIEHNLTQSIIHTYDQEGNYTVMINGEYPQSWFGEELYNSDYDEAKLLSVEQWGDISWHSMTKAYMAAIRMQILATDRPNLSKVTDMSLMFSHTRLFNQNINNWDVSNVTNMYKMFYRAYIFNQPLNNWDVSSVTNMYVMFSDAKKFNQPLSNWDVSSVTDMRGMFYTAHSFNQELSSWNVSKVTNMGAMFQNAYAFNSSLKNWDVSSVSNMTRMFYNASSFNKFLNDWDVSSVSDMTSMFMDASSFNQSINQWQVQMVYSFSRMFEDATSFNQPLNDWSMSNAKYMSGMFENATSFNQPLENWDVSSVIWMDAMFEDAISFNQPLNEWDVSSVEAMNSMFNRAYAFNQPLDMWDVSSIKVSPWFGWRRGMNGMFHGVILSTENYDAMLTKWAEQSVQQNIYFGAGESKYSLSSQTARDKLQNDFNWTITDGGIAQ